MSALKHSRQLQPLLAADCLHAQPDTVLQALLLHAMFLQAISACSRCLSCKHHLPNEAHMRLRLHCHTTAQVYHRRPTHMHSCISKSVLIEVTLLFWLVERHDGCTGAEVSSAAVITLCTSPNPPLCIQQRWQRQQHKIKLRHVDRGAMAAYIGAKPACANAATQMWLATVAQPPVPPCLLKLLDSTAARLQHCC